MKEFSAKDIVSKHGFRFSKSLGQNFLVDNSVLDDILANSEVSDKDLVVEIGPGVGTLTNRLLKMANRVCAIELDSNLIPILEEELKDFSNLELIHGDALKVDFSQLTKGYDSVKFVANLPYYITTPIISRILNDNIEFDSMIVMIQKEVGERIAAEPNCKQYGAISVLVQYYCDVHIIRKVSPHSFIPVPKVDSIVIKLKKLHEPRIKVRDRELFFKVVRLSFNMRRKTLWNALKPIKIPKMDMESVFKISGIDQRRRGETLSLEEFGKLSDCIYELL
ncbi:MAG: 16S rRNA (adenine(1518)-N(6)/adenine(1519)-N(6))-dimethyltransferase RsmA [Clostridium sp.]|jgi:16S rRNA (adenine1518-N6/adenine1519-N6)-dimethyltransferase|uniref:16S rRNA (adenine(1518)-N(6)/adenine(1519)-N(6))- dimethyltransferase RsmA n=1 Tax=Clostridium sp. TaxID=1506 RepID=UPI0025C51069|nr:16S rRNA (adenine(1518)-N(6)/adenine(1519)-N(6))-dimethyltransferase RsmA [Clostridium sp.]MCH3965353.1 16S rRNA (adenine(1518)-N(6)/adenine(1519)-N(6))-dimethyltransferase RsmA [Clostridium sp.]MCI1714574.1 16S rRNA (adenine(1518)-N(6)/adenine(1519)-N(6))-dimethyltransferase RsmA [Clostridium sp.]MCI1798836.1 16S rRNA (adenine(1518)-N(6)/adenine(1519)-N(6))-dimethyltransferase RsmA [Clostridium sp.]MCI1812433.1 16S rRNA (adenine(1518)-N(6)/adenine(1519)-N(6))-dimethyltransferase RsmA [Clost